MLYKLIIETIWLLVLAVPIACISWTVTHEEVFREPREYCRERSKTGKTVWVRKFFYLFTCEYCFSHYVTAGAVIFTGYKLLMEDWRGYIIAGFALVWLANIYMSLYSMMRATTKEENLESKLAEKQLGDPIANKTGPVNVP